MIPKIFKSKQVVWANLAGLAVLVLLVQGLPSMADTQPDDPVADPVETRQEEPCAKTIDELVSSDAFVSARDALSREPGFVDLVTARDGGDLVVRAVFDADERQGPLPSSPHEIEGVSVEYVAERFIPLPVLEESLGPDVQMVVPGPCPQEIRPGSRMDGPSGCTFNFVYTDASGRYYIGTAGHCVGFVGQRASGPGVGTFGTVVYRIEQGVGADFALIRVDPGKENLVNPELCHWGGPTRLSSSGSLWLHHYGWGIGYGTLPQTRPRTGTLLFTGEQSFTFTGGASFGDSGSGAVTNTGSALGTITHIGAGSGTVFGTTATHGVSLAEDATGLRFSLETAPFHGIDP